MIVVVATAVIVHRTTAGHLDLLLYSSSGSLSLTARLASILCGGTTTPRPRHPRWFSS